MSVILEIAIVVTLLLFPFVYKRESTWKKDKTKSVQNGLQSYILKFLQLSILIAVIANLWQTNDVKWLGTGLFLEICGLFMIYISKKTLGINFSECTDMYTPFKIVSNGPYKWIRHPIYSGNLLFVLGLAIGFRSYSLLLIFFMLCFFYWQSSGREEGELLLKHPQYRAYKEKAGRVFPKSFRGYTGNSVNGEIEP